jgi:hypothetical protein
MVDAELDLIREEWDFSPCAPGDRLIIVGGNKTESETWMLSIKPLLKGRGLRVTIVGYAHVLRGMMCPAYYVLIGSWHTRIDVRAVMDNLKIMKAIELRPKMVPQDRP